MIGGGGGWVWGWFTVRVSGPHSEYFIHSKLFLDLHLLVPCTINYRKRAEQDGERGEDET